MLTLVLQKLVTEFGQSTVGILIGFCNLALANRVCSGQASSGITDGPTLQSL
jgi:hypothetical protein